MKFLDLTVGDVRLRARVLSERSPQAADILEHLLPIDGLAVQDPWSGQILEIRHEKKPSLADVADAPVFYQHPGLVVMDRAGRIAVCFGEARFQNGAGPIVGFPIAEIGGDLKDLAEVGASLSVEGAREARLALSSDQSSSLPAPPIPRGRQFTIELSGIRATAVLLEDTAPKTTAALAEFLPLIGTATNTVWSGPLTRFWNPSGGPEGETPLEVELDNVAQVLLYPGFIYYLPVHPWRGLRISTVDTTMMKGSMNGGDGMAMIPVAKFIDDWSAFREEAEKLIVEGAKEMRIDFEL